MATSSSHCVKLVKWFRSSASELASHVKPQTYKTARTSTPQGETQPVNWQATHCDIKLKTWKPGHIPQAKAQPANWQATLSPELEKPAHAMSSHGRFSEQHHWKVMEALCYPTQSIIDNCNATDYTNHKLSLACRVHSSSQGLHEITSIPGPQIEKEFWFGHHVVNMEGLQI